MELKLDLTKEYGIVLEGGGAKGAYQIGAWKALREAGVRIKGIAGASVGSLNGALICMDDLEKAEDIWKNIEYSRVMDVSDETIKALKKKDFKALNMQEILNSGFQFIKEHKELAVDVKSGEEGSVKDMLLASAYFLAFKNEKLGGKRYRDGGGFNNVPLGVLLDKGYEDIIVIRIYGWGFDSEKVTKIPEGANVYHIAPRQDLGGILEFDKKQSRKNMTLGYFDAKRFLYGLAGRIYYIDAPGSEPYYFDKMMSELELLKIYVEEDLDQETRESLKGYRMFTETLFPRMAVEFKLKDDWNYRDLYIAILEDLAKRLKINRFQIYTVDRLIGKIMMKLHSLDSRIPL